MDKRSCNFRNSDSSTFDGMSLLANKLSKTLGSQCPELHLLKCLELIELEDVDEARISQKQYVEAIKVLQLAAHPLYLLALARNSDSEADRVKYLRQFSGLYSNAVGTWLKDSEKQHLSNRTSSDDQHPMSESNNPVDRWKALKEEETVHSDAMEKLLHLTGLKKVKNSAIDLFKSALVYNRLESEARAANVKTCNYCFLGNAVSLPDDAYIY